MLVYIGPTIIGIGIIIGIVGFMMKSDRKKYLDEMVKMRGD